MGKRVLVMLAIIAAIALGSYIEHRALEKARDLHYNAQQLIKQCEQILPRNQHCEVVITARVVEEGVK